MATTKKQISLSSFLRSKINDYVLLVKLRLSLLVVFSACATFYLGSSVFIVNDYIFLVLGGLLVTWASNAINQVLEKDTDKLMKRTSQRPLATGRMDVSEAVLSAGIMFVVGVLSLLYFNPQTAVLGAISFATYSFIYTPLKRVSPVAVWVGAIPGALPMSIGWVAATGELGVAAIVLFSIQFFWQFPHFWAIAWIANKDYTKAGFYLLPSSDSDGRNRSTAIQCIVYAICLIPLSFVPYYIGMTGIVSVVVLLFLALVYTYYSIVLLNQLTDKAARALMFCSFFYLPVSLITLMIDKL